GLSYNGVGRAKRAPTLQVELELLDMNQYDLFANADGDTVIKARVRLNGPEIELGFRHYVEVDLYGTFDDPDWGVLENSNRTLILNLTGERNAAAGTDIALRIQNDRANL